MTVLLRCSPKQIAKFNPFHDARGRFASAHGFKTYSANPKSKAGANAITRSNNAGHGRTLNVHRESKGESIQQNANWLSTGKKPAVPAAVSRQRYQNRKQQQQQAAQQQQTAAKPAQPPQQKPKQSPGTNTTTQQKPPVNPSVSVSSGQAQNAVNGKDLAGKFQFTNSTQDYAIEQVIKAQGFDGKPTITNDAAEFAKACQASNFIAKRGVGATDKKTLDSYDQALKTGDFYVKCSGGSVHGYGMYAASLPANGSSASSGIKHAESTANSYASGRAKKVYTMTLDKSAKIGTENDLVKKMAKDTEFNRICSSSGMKSSYVKDVGVYAAYKGYDAYISRNGRMNNSGSFSDYTVILNRSKVIILDS